MVFLYVEVQGPKPRDYSLTLDEEEAFLTEGTRFIHYYYDPAKRNRTQKLIFTFELENGVVDKHSYEIVHGFRQLKRIDPPGV